MSTSNAQEREQCQDCPPTHVQPASEKTMARSPGTNDEDGGGGLSAPESKKIYNGQTDITPDGAHAPKALGAPEASTSKSSSAPTDGGEVAEILPPKPVRPSIIIEFCDRCRWAPRATWIQTELFLTFPSPLLKSITLIPLNAPETGGRFRVWLDIGDGHGDKLVWDRKTEGGFPELKVLKQRIRNHVQPNLDLGHSDTHGK